MPLTGTEFLRMRLTLLRRLVNLVSVKPFILHVLCFILLTRCVDTTKRLKVSEMKKHPWIGLEKPEPIINTNANTISTYNATEEKIYQVSFQKKSSLLI